jgi:DNA phosphorothioation-associated putative methyltransferase
MSICGSRVTIGMSQASQGNAVQTRYAVFASLIGRSSALRWREWHEMGTPNEHMTNELLSDLECGKFVGGHLYLHTSALSLLPDLWRQVVGRAADLTGLRPDADFNVVKLSNEEDELSLLHYRDFFEDPFPCLGRSWRVSLLLGTVVYRTYEESRNPPILHRKELLLPLSHPGQEEYRATTQSAEALGLFKETNRIGFRAQWEALIGERGYALVNREFVPIANVVTVADEAPIVLDEPGKSIRRHLTALSRANFSAPVQALLRHGLIHSDSTVFDYGCGKGDDVRNLCTNGIQALGWDPHYANDAPRQNAQVVNLGFVINVIEDVDERVAALRRAYALTDGVLSVAAMLTSQMPPDGRPYCDGYLSSRNTFQKYFSQAQLRDFIEQTLDESAIAVVPGVFFVFRDKELEQRFLAARYGQRSGPALSPGWFYARQVKSADHAKTSREPKVLRIPGPVVDRATQLFLANEEAFHQLWLRALELGRPPGKDEVDNDLRDRIEQSIGSWSKAIRIVLAKSPAPELELARAQRSADLLVFGARQQFEKRAAYRQFDPGLKADIRAFFGEFTTWQASARAVLFKVGNLADIDAACREAAEKGYGWLEEGQSLQVHFSLLERLPTLLRVYVACATLLCGDMSEFDLIKIHIRSGKITLLKFDDFETRPLPRLVQRIKVNLRDQDLDLFTYGEEYLPTLLYYKSRFINEEFPHFAAQVAFETAVEQLGLHDLSGYGPSETAFHQVLTDARWEVVGFELRRSSQIPDLHARCGANFTYRHFLECGETQERTGLANRPQQPDTYTAVYELAKCVIDPVVEYYGMIQLTYGFCSRELASEICGRIAPELDQHAGHELKKSGKPICERLGAACDFLVEDEDMEEVAIWVFENTNVDRVYVYGKDRPIHVSYSQTPARQLVEMKLSPSGRRVPRVIRK